MEHSGSDTPESGPGPDPARHSRFLTWVLRHAPGAVGLRLDPAGWVEVPALLAACRAHGMDLDRRGLVRLVAQSDKQRFSLSPDGRRIRAVQGHSVPVQLGHPEADPPARLYHGTVARFVASIRREGLRPGQRHHVHLSADPDTAAAVGRRRGTPVVLGVRADAMQVAGYRFYWSPNGVWLTERVPPRFLEFPPA